MRALAKTTAAALLLHLLPQDILLHILSNLPAKSLLRFRCVSKFFYALIAHHAFGVLHRSFSFTLPSRAAILIAITPRIPLSARFSPTFYAINFSEQNPHHPGMLQAHRLRYLDAQLFRKGSLRSSSDGLICMYRPNKHIVVCNVSTGQHISLPTIHSHCPYLSSSCALLGFDSQSKRYKVLMIDPTIRSINSFEYKHWVLTVGVDKSWREINYSGSHPFYPFDAYACPSYSDTSVHITFYPFDAYACPSYSDTSVHIDGVIYSFNWLTKDDPPSFHIVAFEVVSETYSLIPFPAEISSSSSQYQCGIYVLGNFALLQVDGGRLAIVLHRPCYMDVWIWEKSKECWEIITMIIPLEDSGSIHMYLRYTTNYAGEIVLLHINGKQFSILVCNLKSGVWRKFDVSGVVEDAFRVVVRICRTMDNVFSLEY